MSEQEEEGSWEGGRVKEMGENDQRTTSKAGAVACDACMRIRLIHTRKHLQGAPGKVSILDDNRGQTMRVESSIDLVLIELFPNVIHLVMMIICVRWRRG